MALLRPSRRPADSVDPAIVGDARPRFRTIERRGFLRGTFSLGALTLLTGCDISNESAVQTTLRAMSQWNDRVQGFLFDPDRLAPTYDASQVRKPPRFNAFYRIDQVKPVDMSVWKLELAGGISDKRPWSIDALHALPRETQITRHICVEGWDYIGEWSGPPLKLFLEKIGADLSKRYVAFRCADGYSSSLDMASALHPQTQLATHYAGAVLDAPYGYPLRLRTPIKLGFKLPKWITAIEVTDVYPGGYWEDRGYNWFSGL